VCGGFTGEKLEILEIPSWGAPTGKKGFFGIPSWMSPHGQAQFGFGFPKSISHSRAKAVLLLPKQTTL